MSSTTTQPAALAGGQTDLTLLIARIALVLVFPISGVLKLRNVGGTAAHFASLGAPLPDVAAWVAIACELILPALIVLGVGVRWAALGLILYTAGATIIGHRFWEVAPPAQTEQMFSFFKNIGLMGGFALLAVLGPGRYALQKGP
jgi:putative oxidoreductase